MLVTTIRNFRVKLFTGAVFLAGIICIASLSASAQTATRPCFDFTGSGRTSFATINRDSPAITWRIFANTGTASGSLSNFQYGLSNEDIATPGYFDNDATADVGVYRTTNSLYYINQSSSQTLRSTQFGLPNDVAGREADYDGDGRDDLTVIRDGGSALTWYYLRSSDNTFRGINFGIPGFTTDSGVGDIPIAGADYNGDGRAEITVIRRNPNGGDTYYAGDSSSGALVAVQQWGEFDTDFYVVGDYIGDRRADFAVFRAFQGGTSGTWYILENGGSNTVIRNFGFTSLASVRDRPICGDYNGDGKQDIAIYRSTDSTFYWLNSPNFTNFSAVQFGQPGDYPVAGLRAF